MPLGTDPGFSARTTSIYSHAESSITFTPDEILDVSIDESSKYGDR